MPVRFPSALFSSSEDHLDLRLRKSEPLRRVISSLRDIQQRPHIFEALVFTLIHHQLKTFFKYASGIIIHDQMLSGDHIMLPGRSRCIITSLISNTGRSSVTHHLHDIPHGHTIAVNSSIVEGGIIYPVFKMMSVSAFMMKPCSRTALVYTPLNGIGRLVPVIIFYPHQKLGRIKLGQIMHDSLIIQPAFKTALCNIKLMLAHGL